LQVVLLPPDHVECKRPPTAPGPDEQNRVPRAQGGRGAQKRDQ